MARRLLLFSILFSCFAGTAQSQDVIIGPIVTSPADNSWILHAKQDHAAKDLFIAPYNYEPEPGEEIWNWKKQTIFQGDGLVDFPSNIQVFDIVSKGSNSWIFHTPDDGRTELYLAPLSNGNWDWSKVTTFSNNGNVLFTGNIGIGTNNTSQAKLHVAGQVLFGNRRPATEDDWKLAVDGKIMSTEVKVTAPDLWADYVFRKDYKLLSLEEVESYVLKNKHLPDLPSAKEVAQNGINLGEMDNLLLKKIEELTLYMIEMKKENTSLKTANQELTHKLDGLAKQVNQRESLRFSGYSVEEE